MCNITFVYEKDPDNEFERDLSMSFGCDDALPYDKLVEMFVDFSRVLGYVDGTIERYINMEEQDDEE